jgi:hypothetical protein
LITLPLSVQARAEFTMPGRTLSIFPSGALITCLWIAIFFIVFGLGTIGRILSRNKYRSENNTIRSASVAATGIQKISIFRRLVHRPFFDPVREVDPLPVEMEVFSNAGLTEETTLCQVISGL